MAASDKLYKLADRANQAEQRAAAARQEAKTDVESTASEPQSQRSRVDHTNHDGVNAQTDVRSTWPHDYRDSVDRG